MIMSLLSLRVFRKMFFYPCQLEAFVFPASLTQVLDVWMFGCLAFPNLVLAQKTKVVTLAWDGH